MENSIDLTETPTETIQDAVNEMELLPEQKIIIVSIVNWAKRMTELYGDTVVSKDGTSYDWGQALCRERFGVNWEDHMVTHNIAIPTRDDLGRALEWEEGEIPDWVNQA
jgi:hypothetical protein